MARAPAEVVAMVLLASLLAGHAAARSQSHRSLLQKPSRLIKSVIVLGDSVSDVGLPHGAWSTDNSTAPYAQFGYDNGRFSNGPVWIEYLCADYNLTQVNYAVGGSTVQPAPGALGVLLALQLQKALTYLQNNTLPSPSLGIISIGANDLVALISLPEVAGNQTAVLQWANNVISASADAAQALLDAGVDNIAFVPSFDALKASPLMGLLAFAPALKQLLYNLVYIMNKQMSAATARLNGASSTKAYYIDAAPDLMRINAHPEKYGLLKGNTACVTFDPPGSGYDRLTGDLQPTTLVSACSTPNSYFFWDILHPTTAGHRLVANIVGSKLRKAKLLP